MEKLLEGFEPDFEFKPVPPLPKEEFEERARKLRRGAVENECDALILHTDNIGWYHTSNSYLRYICDWMREGVLIMPTDEDKPSTILAFFSDAVLLPPPGEPTWVDDIRQTGVWGREAWERPGDTRAKLVQAVKEVTDELGVSEGKLGLIGDFTSAPLWSSLARTLPKANSQDQTHVINEMQWVKSKKERDLVRAAAQLADIGIQAAYHVTRPGITDYEVFAAFTFAQMARGGETGDGYQIGINACGTHICKPYGHVIKPGDVHQSLHLSCYLQGVRCTVRKNDRRWKCFKKAGRDHGHVCGGSQKRDGSSAPGRLREGCP